MKALIQIHNTNFVDKVWVLKIKTRAVGNFLSVVFILCGLLHTKETSSLLYLYNKEVIWESGASRPAIHADVTLALA
jgi:hypothetical protein